MLLHEFARDRVMIGYNSSNFDCPTVINQNKRYGVVGTSFAFPLDAMRLPGVRGRLIDAAASFGVTSDTYHRAMADVWVTARLVEIIDALFYSWTMHKFSDGTSHSTGLFEKASHRML